MRWWQGPLGDLVAGRRVILAGGPAAFWTPMVTPLLDVGATDVLVVATSGAGVGAQPAASTVIVEPPYERGAVMASIRASLAALAAPPPHVLAALEAFDPDGTAIAFGSFLTETPTLLGRPFVAHRRPEWVALEDKTTVDAVFDRAGIVRAESMVLPIADATGVWRRLDDGAGTVWAADARDGYHGGATLTRWVTDEVEAAAVSARFRDHCDVVRVMPFLDGIATSVHGIVLPDGVVSLRPVELVTLRAGHHLRYAGCATFWDPPSEVRDEMREAARRLGELLRAEVGFRGAFTLDGVATAAGFRPTELNPRFGVGLGVITTGLVDVPLHLVLDLVVAGRALPISAGDLEAEILEQADGRRTGGSWQPGVSPTATVEDRPVSDDGGEWRWTEDGGVADARVTAGPGFSRVDFDPDRTPVGPSVGERSAAFWRFADAELGTDIGPLTAPADVAGDDS